MRRLTRLSLTAFATLGFAGMTPFAASAADQNTYRPGHAYLKTAAGSFEACEQQCRGDAQCRGWNFVRPNPRSQSGICEFNERSAMPVASAISISGEINTSVDPLMSRAVPSGSRTVRVGTPTVPVQKPAQTQRGKTNVQRMPVPKKQGGMHPTAYKQPTAQKPNVRQSRVYSGQTPAPSAPQTNRGPNATPQQLTPQQQHFRQQFLLEQKRQQQIRAQQQAALRRQQQMANPQMAPPQSMQQPMPQPMPQSMQRQLPPQAQVGPPAPAQAAPVPARPRGPISGPMVQQSLYGSLHDDLTKNLTPVPRPATAPDNPANPDAPLSTSRAAPSKPVESKPLTGQAVPGLAGG